MEPLNLASIAEIGGKYTSQRSEIISYILIALCAVAFVYLIIHQIRSHITAHSPYVNAFFILLGKHTVYCTSGSYMPAKKAVIGYFRFFLTLGCLQKEDFNFYCNYNSTEVSLF